MRGAAREGGPYRERRADYDQAVDAARRWIAEHGRYPQQQEWEHRAPGRPTTRTIKRRWGWVELMRAAAGAGARSPELERRRQRRLELLLTLRRAHEELGRWSRPASGRPRPASTSPGALTSGSSGAGEAPAEWRLGLSRRKFPRLLSIKWDDRNDAGNSRHADRLMDTGHARRRIQLDRAGGRDGWGRSTWAVLANVGSHCTPPSERLRPVGGTTSRWPTFVDPAGTLLPLVLAILVVDRIPPGRAEGGGGAAARPPLSPDRT